MTPQKKAFKAYLMPFCAIAWIASPLLRAQTFGEITGTVTEPSGAVVVGATVSVTNMSTNQIRRVQTNQTGNYTVPFLVPGVYDVRAELSGFRVASRNGVDLQVGAVARIDFPLQLGEMSQHVDVTGGAPLLTTESTAVGTVIENKRIVELPLNGRDYLQLVALSPNVTTEGGAGGGSGIQGGQRSTEAYSIAGQRLEFNNYTLDGMENTDVNFNSYIIRPSIDALQEFKVQTGVYSAEFGRSTSQISVLTKSGANGFHGTAFEFLRNSDLDAKQWRQQGDKNPFRQNQYGFTLGGRLIKNKLFFMSNYEALKSRKTTEELGNVATNQMRIGDFSGQPQAIYDPLSRVYATGSQGSPLAVSATPYPNNTIPQNEINPIAVKLLGFYPAPTVPGNSILSNYVRDAPQPISTEQFTQRIDWNQSARSSWFGRYSWTNEYNADLSVFPDTTGRVETAAYQAMLSNTYTFGAATVNEFRFGFNQFNNANIGHFADIQDVVSGLGIIGLATSVPAAWGVPTVSLVNGLTSLGDTDPYVTRDSMFQWMDDISIIRGKHVIKLGGEIRRDRYNELGNQKARGEFDFTGQATFNPANRSATGNSFADFMIGDISTSQYGVGTADAMLRSTAFYLYFQDDWKITSRLTMNLGLRYENTRPWHDKYCGIMNFQVSDLGVGANGLLPSTKVPIFTRPCSSGDFYQGLSFHFADGIPTQVGTSYMGTSLVKPDNNDFAPRLGFAYSPANRWTLRTAFGVFYAQDTANPVFDMARNIAGLSLFSANVEQPNSNLSNPWVAQRASVSCTDWSGPCLATPKGLGNIYARRTPYVNQWLFNVQRQLSENILLEVGYLGSEGHKLQRERFIDEAVQKTGPKDASSVAQRQPWPAFSRIMEVDGGDNSNYNALSAKLQQRFTKGLTSLVAFTWSKSIDDGSGIRTNSGDLLNPENSYDLAAMRGLSQFNVGRRLVASLLYDLPFGSGKRFATRMAFLDKVIGGWQTGSIITLATGTPNNLGYLGDTNSVGTPYNLPNATGISPIPQHQTASQFWNIAAFDTTNPNLSYQFGNVGRSVLINPGTREWDFSLAKNTSIREGQSLQFRFEAFNIPNYANWNPPSSDATSKTTFGVVTSARTMRELQFGLKYVF